jgi:membrane protein implicated in regulation of membrane protease activity
LITHGHAMSSTPLHAAPGSASDLFRSARGVTGAYVRLAIAETALARRALLRATLRAGIALALGMVAAILAAASAVAGLVALGLAWPWATLIVAAVLASIAFVSGRRAADELEHTRFEATRRQLDRLFD